MPRTGSCRAAKQPGNVASPSASSSRPPRFGCSSTPPASASPPRLKSWLYMLWNRLYWSAMRLDATDRGDRRGRARHDARGGGQAPRLPGRAPGARGRGPGRERQEFRPGLGERQAGGRRARPGAARPRAVGRAGRRRAGPCFRPAGSLTVAADEAELRAAQGSRRAARRGPARLRAARPGRRPGGQPGPARRAGRRPAVPGRRYRRAPAGAARAARLPGRPRLRVAART